jgi:hypothetical protein
MDEILQPERTVPAPPRCEGELDCENTVVILFLGTGAKMCEHCAIKALSELEKEIDTDVNASLRPISRPIPRP